jgi:hypothetical protein
MPHLLDRPRAQRLSRQGSDLQKPDGLVVITHDNLPEVLPGLALQDIYGIGKRTEERLRRAGITTVTELFARHRCGYGKVWGGIYGLLFHQMLHGADIRPPSSRFARSMGYQHVLEPELRIRNSGAKSFSQQLLTKAAERLRYGDYYCRRLGLHLSWIGDLGGFWDDISFHETRDAGFLIACLDKLWRRVPRYKPLSVDVVCSTWCQPIGTSPISSSTTGGRNCRLWSTVSTTATARGAIGFGLLSADVRAFRAHAALPEASEF